MLFLVTGAGAGYCRRMPGTIGTLIAVPLSFGLNRIAAGSLPLSLLVWAALVVSAIALSTRGAEILGQKDPGQVVIDEIVGFLTASFCIPPGLVPLALAFVLFRLFDIVEVYPARPSRSFRAAQGSFSMIWLRVFIPSVSSSFYRSGECYDGEGGYSQYRR